MVDGTNSIIDAWITNAGGRNNHRAYINPTGVFFWDRYGFEEALQIQWAAKTLHPDRFTGLNMVAETKSFYSRFLHYRLTDDQAHRILAAQHPS